MFLIHTGRSKPGRASILVLVLAAAGCAHVQSEELEGELEQIRQEMRGNDEALEQRLGEQIRSLEDRVDRRIAMLEEELDELREEFEIAVERLESALRFNAPVHFAFDDAELDEDGREVLERFADVVREYYQDAVITVEGFTDPAGDESYNLRLGERRAEAVVGYLEDAGIPEDRLRAVSYGEAQERQVVPDARGPGDDGRENRRAAMVVDFDPSTLRGPVAEAGGGGR